MPSESQLEQQFTMYLAQVRSGKRAAPLSLADPNLAQATIRFAGVFGMVAIAARPKPRAGTASKRSAPTPFKSLLDTAADFVTPGDLLRSESLATLGKLEERARPRSARRAAVETEASKLARVEAQVFEIVAKLTPGTTAGDIERKTRFAADLGWDEWSLLRLVRPVRDTFGVRLAAAAVKKLKKVGELVDAVWEKLEEEAS